MSHEEFINHINNIADFIDASDEESAKAVVDEMNEKIKAFSDNRVCVMFLMKCGRERVIFKFHLFLILLKLISYINFPRIICFQFNKLFMIDFINSKIQFRSRVAVYEINAKIHPFL